MMFAILSHVYYIYTTQLCSEKCGEPYYAPTLKGGGGVGGGGGGVA